MGESHKKRRGGVQTIKTNVLMLTLLTEAALDRTRLNLEEKKLLNARYLDKVGKGGVVQYVLTKKTKLNHEQMVFL